MSDAKPITHYMRLLNYTKQAGVAWDGDFHRVPLTPRQIRRAWKKLKKNS